MEYNSASTAAVLNEVRVTGKESKSEVQKRPEINTVKYEESEYNVEITEMIRKRSYGIIERRLGKAYKDWFKLELAENPKKNGYDYFELSMDGDQVKNQRKRRCFSCDRTEPLSEIFLSGKSSQVGDRGRYAGNKPCCDRKVLKRRRRKPLLL